MIIRLFQILILFCVFGPLKSQNLNNGLMAYYPFDGNALDYSGNNNNGILSGPTPSSDRFNLPNKAYYFNGSSQININNSATMNPTAGISVCAWYKPINFSGAGYSAIFTKGFTSHTAPYYQYKLGVMGNGYGNKFAFSICVGGIEKRVTAPNNSWSPDNWYFLVGTYDGSQLKLYINNALITSTAVTGSLTTFPTNIRFGNNTTANDFVAGTIDDGRLYNRALTTQEIDILYNCTLPGSPVNLTPPANTNLCSGNSTTLTAIAASTINWYANPTSTISLGSGSTYITPVLNAGTYTYYVASTNICTESSRIPIVVSVGNGSLNLNITGQSSICPGSIATLTITGADSYTWSNGANTSTISISPTITTIYNVIGTSTVNSCNGSASKTITVHPGNFLSAAGNGTICEGGTTNLAATGAITYTWQPGNYNGFFITVNPLSNTIYTVTGTNQNGCTDSSTINITVIPCGTTGMKNNMYAYNSVYVFPNPNNGECVINTNNFANKQIEVTDLQGRIVFKTSSNSETVKLNISHLENGIYHVKVITSEKNYITRLVKQ